MNVQPGGFGVREILTTLFAHLRLIIGLTVLAGVAAAGFALVQSKVWESSVRVVVQQNRQAVRIGTSEAPITGPLLLSQGEQVRTEMQILSSPVVVAAAAQALGPERLLERMRWRWDWLRDIPNQLRDKVRDFVRATVFGIQPGPPTPPLRLAMKRIAAHMEVEPVRESSVFMITVKTPDGPLSAELLDAVVQAYVAHHITVRQGAATSGIFAGETERAQKELAAAIEREQALKQSSGIVEAQAQKQLLLQRLSDAEAAYQRARIEKTELQRRVAESEAQLRARAPNRAVQNTVGRNPELEALRQQLTQVEIERDNYQPGSAAARSLDLEIENTRNRLRRMQDRVSTSQVSGPNTTFLEIERGLLADKARLQGLGSLSDLRGQLDSYRRELSELDANAAVLAESTRDVDLKKETLQVWQRKQQEERLGGLLNKRHVSDVVPIESAMAPDVPSGPRVMLTAVIGLGTGLLAGLGLAFLAEYLRRTITTREEALAQLGQPVLGSFVERDSVPAAAALNQIELRQVAEALRLEATSVGRGIAVLITSTSPGEGKTTLARDLVRLLGSDARECALLDVSSGRPPSRAPTDGDDRPATAAEVAATRSHIAELCASSRLVIVDGPALGGSADGFWLPEVTDGTVLVLQAERTTGINAMRTIRLVQAGGSRCLGIVLTRRRFVIPGWMYGWLLSPRHAMQP